MLTRRLANRRRALMERRLPPQTRFPGKRWRSVEPVEMEMDEPDPLESLELEEDMDPEESTLLPRMPPRAPSLPMRKIRLRRLSSLRRRSAMARLAAKKKSPEYLLRQSYEMLLQEVAGIVDRYFMRTKTSPYESAEDLMESKAVEKLIEEELQETLQRLGLEE